MSFFLTLNRDNSSYFPTYNMFRIWNKIVRKNRNVEIAKKNFIYDRGILCGIHYPFCTV